jgi:pimeloyl-ACP methyl ester carboxylesterase
MATRDQGAGDGGGSRAPDAATATAPAAAYVPAVPQREETLELRGVTHRLLRWGPPSDDPVLLLHGLLDTAETFQLMVDALPRNWSFVAPDWRGFGNSGWNAAPYWFPDYLADLEALLDRLQPAASPPARPLRVIGHSMGGNVCSMYAGIRPGRFRWLVSMEGFGLPRTSPDQAPARYAGWLDELRAGVKNSRYESLAQLTMVLARRNPRLPPANAAFLARAWSRPRADGGLELRADPWHRLTNPVLYRRDEAEACWRRADLPMLLVIGAESEFHRRLGEDGTGDYFRSVFQRLDFATVDGAGHMMHHENPSGSAQAIVAWASRLP